MVTHKQLVDRVYYNESKPLSFPFAFLLNETTLSSFFLQSEHDKHNILLYNIYEYCLCIYPNCSVPAD